MRPILAERILWLVSVCCVAALTAGVENGERGKDEETYATDDARSSSLHHWPALQGTTNDRASDEESGWSPWGNWSLCSRSCDGGVTGQTRTCESRHGCRGESLRHQICNMQPCPEATDFRHQQCSRFNTVKYHGELYEWEPHYDAQDPCSLTCRAKGHNLVAQLYPKVLDGTRCREGSLDMCINGKCQPVGCDLQLGSTKKVDACGVCGGNGSSCGHPSFHWDEAPMSNCSATCGGGMQMSRPVCKNKQTGRTVDERLCDVTTRPAPTTRKCNTEKCPAVWIAEDWGTCSVTCSGGFQERRVYCADALTNGTVVRVDEARCSARRPKEVRSCNAEECPRWYETDWSGCSATCGQGYQSRNVVCRDFRGHVSDACDLLPKPSDRRPCSTGLSCPTKVKPFEEDRSSTELYSPLVQPYPPQAQRFTGTDILSSEPRFTPEPWSPCSVTCGEGVRKRRVLCKIFLEFSRTEAVMEDKECPGKKSPETERCVARPCSLNRVVVGEVESNTVESRTRPDRVPAPTSMVSYSWRQVGFTPCSASCLGGVRESIIQCVRDRDQATVSPFLCDLAKKPDAITQTCHDQPCLPRWNVSEFTECSKTCGGGIRTRQVQCIHEVTRGNTLVIPDTFCREPRPKTEQTCGLLDCRPQWVTGPWTKCSRTCGGGTKTRKIECEQLLSIGESVPVRSPDRCPARRPPASKPCNPKPCGDVHSPEIHFINQTYVQTSPLKKISLKVGGRAVVFKGTRLKIKCPVKKFDRARIRWAKDHDYLQSSRRFRISRKGTLKIRSVQYTDSGVYVCVAGRSKANITVDVKPRPVPFPGSDEDRTVEHPENSVENQYATKIVAKPSSPFGIRPKLETIEDDDEGGSDDLVPGPTKPEFSHEQNGENSWPPIPSPPPKQKPQLKTYKQSEEKANSLEVQLNHFDTREFFYGNDDEPSRDENSDEPDFRKAAGGKPRLSPGSFPDVLRSAWSGGRPGDDPETSTGSRIQRILGNFQQPFGGPRGTESGGDAYDEMPYADGQMMANSFVLGKGKPENIQFVWKIANWSTCSRTCGGQGVQMRATQCVVRLHNVSKPVDNSLCIDAKLEAPPTLQKCGLVECPRWETGPYSGCNESRCFGPNASIQRRSVRCVLGNGTRMAGRHCDVETKPREKRECYNDKCRGTWRVEPWSECNAGCGETGIRSRLLKCVWYGTQRPAGNACQDRPRPSVLQRCKGPPCSDLDKCVDLSQYCSPPNKVDVCRMPRYRSRCCKTCKGTPS